MKALLIGLCLVLITPVCRGQGQAGKNRVPLQQGDSLILKIDGNTAYYQNTVKVDTGIGVNLIYVRTLQFMAAKNFQQTYGFEEEGKEIFTTTQDLAIGYIIFFFFFFFFFFRRACSVVGVRRKGQGLGSPDEGLRPWRAPARSYDYVLTIADKPYIRE